MKRLLFLVVLLAYGSALGPSAAAPAIRVETGAWFLGQVAGLPAPPTVPSGGLWISGTILGPYAFSAIRFQLPADQGNPVLSLHVARLTGTPATPLGTGQNPIVACLTTSNWKPTGAAPGAWSTAPTYDCTNGEVSGSFSTDGATLDFDLSSMTRPGQLVSIALVPGTISNPIPPLIPVPVPQLPPLPGLVLGLSLPNPTGGQLAATFDATFLPLTSAGVRTATVAASSPPPPSVAPAPAPLPLPVTAPAFASPLPPVSSPAPPVSAPVLAAPPTSALPAVPPTLAIARPAAHTSDNSHRVLAAFVLGVVAAWGAQLLLRRRDEASLSLYDVPPPGATRPGRRLRS